MKNNFFLKQNLKVVKLCGLTVLVFYSIGVVLFNILYYKYQKQENILFPKINFGIDIVGGKQLTIAVDTSGVVDELSNNNNDFLQSFCKEKKVNCKIQNDNGNFLITATRGTAINTKQDNKQFIREIRSYLHNYNVEVLRNDDKELVISSVVSQKGIDGIIADTTDKAISILKNRIDGVGVKEIAIQRYGTDKIVILVPKGVNIDRIKKVVNTTAKLDFYLMDRTHIFDKKPQQIMANHMLLPSYKPVDSGNDIFYLVENKPALSGNCMSNVQPTMDGISNAINFRLDNNGAKKFAEITKNNIGRLLAIVLDGRVLMAPMINVPIVGGSGSITGHFTVQEVQDLSILLRSGSLPAKISIINERLLSSVFDKSVLSTAGKATAICLLLVALLMVLRYKNFGIIAFVALLLNFVFTLTIIAVFGFTLTLPGVAGLILMLGMATDANILIYEKMKELKRQNIEDPKTIIKNSFSRAIGVILDANITTVVATIALFSFGGSFIKGFSLTLIFGIICSIFTAVNITKAIVNEIYKNKKKINI